MGHAFKTALALLPFGIILMSVHFQFYPKDIANVFVPLYWFSLYSWIFKIVRISFGKVLFFLNSLILTLAIYSYFLFAIYERYKYVDENTIAVVHPAKDLVFVAYSFRILVTLAALILVPLTLFYFVEYKRKEK